MGADLTIAGSAIVVLAAIVGLVRAIFKFAVTMRDNTRATDSLTKQMDKLAASVDGRFDALVAEVRSLVARVLVLEDKGKP